MAHFLCSYDYEPEYTAKEVEAKEVEAWLKAAIRPTNNLVVLPQLSLGVYWKRPHSVVRIITEFLSSYIFLVSS